MSSDRDAADAHQYRLHQARELLRELGYREQPDGSFRRLQVVEAGWSKLHPDGITPA